MTLFSINFKKHLLTILLLLIFGLQLSAQEKSKYSLLWKIEGKDQLKPSYLFGTMHVSDERAFNFSDAVLPAIENTEKFALEIQPDSLVIKMFTKPKIELAYLQFKKLLNDDEYSKIAKRFKAINGYDIEESTLYDPSILMSMLSPDDEKETDKTTFVDMHLLGHAKTMQKEIVGLEDTDSQLFYFENATDERKRELLLEELFYDIETYETETEALKKVYITGDINAIDAMIMSYDGYGEEMKSRNIVMTNSIIKQMKNSSIFSAVGAAHLPGNVGLIKMLRDKGYKVTPVEAKFTGVAKNYTIDTSKMSWHTFNSEDYGYTLQTPGIPAIESNNEGLDAYIYTDLITGTNYSYFALDFRSKNGIDKTMFYEKMIEDATTRYNGEIVSKKTITIGGTQGYEIDIKIPEPSDPKKDGVKSVFVFKNGVFYQFLVYGNYNSLNSKMVSRFVNSIKITKPKAIPTPNWYEFKHKKGAFTVKMPSKPLDRSKEIESPFEDTTEPYIINMFMAIDAKNKSNYIIRYNDQPNGYRIDDLEASFRGMAETFTGKAEIIGTPKTIYQNGYIGKEYELYIKGISHSICRLFFRGNRTYLLLAQRLEKGLKADPNNTFFESFKLTDFEEEPIVVHEKQGVKFKGFKNIREILEDEDYDNSDTYFYNSYDYYTKNEQSGDIYAFGFTKLKPYFKIDTLAKFYDLNKENITNYTDTIVRSKKVKVNNNEAVEFVVMQKQDSIYSKYLLWLDKDKFIYTSAFVSKENIDSKTTNNLLYGYLPKTNTTSFNYYSSKTDLLLNNLKSKDSLVFKQAYGAFTYYEFSKDDVPKLYKAIDAKYATTENKEKVIEAIINEFNNVSDDNTVAFLEKIYTNYNLNEALKRSILQIIPELKTPNNLTTYRKLLLNNTPKAAEDYNYAIFSPYFDSIPMAIEDYNGLLKLIDSKKYRSQLLSLSAQILKSSYKNKSNIISLFNNLTINNTKDLKTFINQKASEDFNYSHQTIIYNYLNYFEAFPKNKQAQTIDNFTNQLLDIKNNKWLALRASEIRILHDLKLENQLTNTLLDSLDTRYNIMKAYHKANNLKKVSKKYYNEAAFANLSLQQYLEEIDEWPDKRNLLGTLKLDNVTYYAYALIYDYDGTEESYLAVVKADFKLSQKHDFKTYTTLTDWNYLSDNWKAQSEKLIKKKAENL
ncbi:TraB/GumN family protein [Lacinutrix sp. MedPE-SW]|uniref:TraB/GumN family protein n=1 Tax=Lacinutrix sp. MedPE-SW TaxID=1860087 RepID=UPI0009232225|nr:TraB/GumN family protein [Lacinutrix sp. MedPE-SW]OIQ24028.1 MAG: hypothetical protein BM549_01585 [Lacinutrix sp. MedPE-SW]